MGEILFIAHRIPFPPDRGDKIRSHHVLKALAKLAPVHVAAFCDDDGDHLHEPDLAAVAESHCLVHRGKALPVAGIESITTGKPVSLTAFRDGRLHAYVRKVLRSRPVDAIYVFSGQMVQYVPKEFSGRVVTDLVDVDSAKFEAYGAKGSGPRAWLERREGRLMRDEEARITAASDVTLLVSEAEAALLRSRLPASDRDAAPIHALRNGIDSDFYDSSKVVPEPRVLACGAPRIIFTGQMDYPPNVEAARRAAERIMPRLRERFPAASFHVVGRNPLQVVRELHGLNGTQVWGRVDDIRPWLAAADIALIPLEIARGVQNKVLEAMSMGLPTVVSSQAGTGIEAQAGRDFLTADSDKDLAQAVISLFTDDQRAKALGASAREWIVTNASWLAALSALPQYLGLPKENLCHAA